MNKEEIRERYRERRGEIDNRQKRSAALQHEVMKQVPMGRILSYCSIGTEVETGPLNEILATAGRLALPRVHDGGLEVHVVEDLDHLVEGPFGLLEPPEESRRVPADELAAALVPGLVFDEAGHRLGYGMGYYDRCLAGLNCKTYGVCFREQLYEELLLIEAHDIAVGGMLVV